MNKAEPMLSPRMQTRIDRLMIDLDTLREAENTTALMEAEQPEKFIPITSYTVVEMPLSLEMGAALPNQKIKKKDYVPLSIQNQHRAIIIFSLYLLGIIIAETLTTIFVPAAGLVLHSLLLIGLFAHYGLSHRVIKRHMLAALAFAPLIRIVSLSLPLKDYASYLWYMLVGAPLLLSAFLITRYMGYRLADVGVRLSGWPVQIPIALTGIGFGYLEYLILRPQSLIGAFTLDQVWLPALILLIFTGLLEEFVFRGLMQKAFVGGFGKLRGVLYVSFLFAVLHIGYHSAADVIFVFAVAMFFGWVALRTQSILGVTLAHGLTNICLFLVFPFLVR